MFARTRPAREGELALAVLSARRDHWGRFLFAPPELRDPRLTSEPLTFRGLPRSPAVGKRAPQSS